MYMPARFNKVASTLSEEQVQDLWSIVDSDSLISELYDVSVVNGIYNSVTLDEVRELMCVILKRFENDRPASISQLRKALLSRVDTVHSLIKFRIGNYAEFDFVKRHLPMSTLQKLVCQAIYEHSLGNN